MFQYDEKGVEKYNGIVSIDYTDTIFTLAISIPLLNEQK